MLSYLLDLIIIKDTTICAGGGDRRDNQGWGWGFGLGTETTKA